MDNGEKRAVAINLFYIIRLVQFFIYYNIFSAPLFSRMLGTEEYGVVQIYNTWQAFLTVIIGLYTRGTLSIAKVNFSDEEFKEYQSSVLFLSLIGFIGIFIILLIFHPIVIGFLGLELEYLIILIVHSFGTYCVYFVNTKFTYEMKAQNNLLISVLIALVNFGLSYLLLKALHSEHLYTGRILGMATPYIITGIAIVIYVFKQGKVFIQQEVLEVLSSVMPPLIFHGISGIICASSDRVMLQKWSDLQP